MLEKISITLIGAGFMLGFVAAGAGDAGASLGSIVITGLSSAALMLTGLRLAYIADRLAQKEEEQDNE